MRGMLHGLERSSVSFQIWKGHRICHDILVLSKTSCTDPAAVGPQCECPIQSACTSGSTWGSLLGFQKFLSLFAEAWPKTPASSARYLREVFVAEIFRGFQRFSEICRDFQRFWSQAPKTSGRFLLWAVIWWNVLANIVGVSCAEWWCRRQFFHEVSGKGLASGLPQSHHVTLLRCGCSHIDVHGGCGAVDLLDLFAKGVLLSADRHCRQPGSPCVALMQWLWVRATERQNLRKSPGGKTPSKKYPSTSLYHRTQTYPKHRNHLFCIWACFWNLDWNLLV